MKLKTTRLAVLYAASLLAATVVWLILYTWGVVFHFAGVYITPAVFALALMVLVDILILLTLPKDVEGQMSTESIEPTTRWKIRLEKAEFDKLKQEERFWQIVALARAINALRFVQSVLEPYHESNSPEAQRVRYNSFFFTCALLYEVSGVIQAFGKYYGALPEFRAMAAVMKTHTADELLRSNLYGIRNKLVFHFNSVEIRQQLEGLELEEPIFAIGMGTTNQHVYFELADLCTIGTFLGSAFSNKPEDIQRTTDLIKKVTELALDFVAKADLFILAVLQSSGWEFQKIDSDGDGQSG